MSAVITEATQRVVDRLPVAALGPEYAFAYVAYRDPLGAPLLADLEREYDERYGVEVFGEPAIVEIERYPAELFAAPHGAFLLLLEHGEPISGGAFMPHESGAAEVKRVWTRSDLRGRGLAGIVLAELERHAAELGYERLYLTTGPRQPEARALYLREGYTPLFDVALSTAEIEQIGEPIAFEKHLSRLSTPASESSQP